MEGVKLIKNKEFIGFWEWFFKGSGGKSGFRRLFNLWIFLHILIGVGLSLIIQVNLTIAANSVLLPLVGILIGLAFAWAGNAQALMQSTEIDKLAEKHEGGFIDYVFAYQLAILIILSTIVLWSIAGVEVYDKVWPTELHCIYYFCIKTILYSISSLTIRECWHVVLGSQYMLIVQKKIKKNLQKNDGKN